jgi:hypothetical protein
MASGKGDFKPKLEKHIERLPDYAQRAQEKLQRYFPPAEDRRDSEQQQPPASTPTGSPRRPGPLPVRRPNVDLSVVSDVRSKWAQWNAPAARLSRQKRRTSRALTLWIMLSVLAVLYAVAGYAGVFTEEGVRGALTGAIATVAFVTLGVRSGIRLRRLHRTELPASTAPPPLPKQSSAARQPMQRLAELEENLGELLGQLSAPGAGGAVPELSVSEARSTAGEASAALRALARRIESIERARRNAPAGERSSLDAAVRTLCEQLDEGLQEFAALVAAAGRAVAASSGGLQPAKEALTDATDRLAGLALALRELS